MATDPVTEYVSKDLVRTFETWDLPASFHERVDVILKRRLRSESLENLNIGDMYLLAYAEALNGAAEISKVSTTYYVTFPTRQDYVAWLLTL